MSQNKYQETGDGVQAQHYNGSSWMTKLNILGTAATGETGPTAGKFISGAIGLTGQQDPAYNRLNLFVKIVDETDPSKLPPIGATATLYMWVQPEGQTGYLWFKELQADKPTGKVFRLRRVPQGKYRIGLARSTKGSAVQVRWSTTE